MFIIINCLQFLTNSIYQNCSGTSSCPVNSYCGNTNYCICNAGFIVTCLIPSFTLTNSTLTVNISQTYTYFTIKPSSLDDFRKFKFIITTNQTFSQNITATLWGQSGFLNDLTLANDISSISFTMTSGGQLFLETTYFQFGLQPNGQWQELYLGVKIQSNSTTPLSYQITLYVSQQGSIDQGVFKTIITVLMGVLSVAVLVLIGFCIYNRRRIQASRQRAQKQNQIHDTQHFQQYMPIVIAQRVNIPLQVCSICLSEITITDMIRVTLCRHLFHQNCIDSWCLKSLSCPICRQQFDLQNCKKILGQGLNLNDTSIIKNQNEDDINIPRRQNQIQMIPISNLRNAQLNYNLITIQRLQEQETIQDVQQNDREIINQNQTRNQKLQNSQSINHSFNQRIAVNQNQTTNQRFQKTRIINESYLDHQNSMRRPLI